MENQNYQQTQTTAPYAVASLVLGILSLLGGCLFVGLVLGIVGLVLGNKGLKCVNANPTQYSGIGMLKSGKITSIIGIVLGGIALVWGIIAAALMGGSFLAMFELLGL